MHVINEKNYMRTQLKPKEKALKLAIRICVCVCVIHLRVYACMREFSQQRKTETRDTLPMCDYILEQEGKRRKYFTFDGLSAAIGCFFCKTKWSNPQQKKTISHASNL